MIILNSKGQPITLTREEQFHADFVQRQFDAMHGHRFMNSLGAEINITTLTQIVKKVTEQKFYKIPIAKYVPIVVGQGAWSTNMTTYRSFDAAAPFEDGMINIGNQDTRLASADAAVDAVNVRVFDWAKEVSWSIPELQKAARAQNWDLITKKEVARKRNWDLGIQKIAFLGAAGQNGAQGACLGLLNQAGVSVNSTLITQPISAMTPTQLKAFVATIIEDYRANNNRTAFPNRFVVPESDWNGMASQASPDFPIKSTLQLLMEAFKICTQDDGFEMLPLSYADVAYHADIPAIAGKQCYALYNHDEESLRMDLPVDYTATMANSVNNFQFANAAYGEFTGVMAYRPLELRYYRY